MTKILGSVKLSKLISVLSHRKSGKGRFTQIIKILICVNLPFPLFLWSTSFLFKTSNS